MSFLYRFADGDHVSRHVDGLARANELADPPCWSWNAGDIGFPGRCLGRAIATRKAEQTLIQRQSVGRNITSFVAFRGCFARGASRKSG